MDNYIIELRNKDFLSRIKPNDAIPLQEGINNGEWTNDIDPLMMEEGDTLICRNSFIDTKAIAEQKIIIPEDTTIKMRFLYYQMNWNGVKRVYNHPNWQTPFSSMSTAINGKDNDVLPFTNGKHHVSCNSVDNGSDFSFLPTITYQGQHAGDVGGFKVVAVFKGLNNQVQNKVIEIPKYNEVGWGTEATVNVDITFNSAIPVPETGRAIGFYLSKNPKGNDPASNEPDLNSQMDGTALTYSNTKIIGLSGITPMSADVFTPAEKELDFILPAGNYNPQDLCTTINSLATEARGEPSSDSNLINNNLLITFGGRDLPNQGQNFFIETKDINETSTGRYGFSFQGGNPPLGSDPDLPTSVVGASQFVLSFEADTTQRFSFDYLHMPIFSDAQRTTGGDNLQGGYARSKQWEAQASGTANPTLPEATFKCNKNSGIIFTSLQPRSFWADKLGFDLDLYLKDPQTGKDTNVPNPNCILASYEMRTQDKNGADYNVNGLPATLPFFLNQFQDGKNTTGGFIGLNSTFVKGKNFQNVVQLAIAPNTGETNSAFVNIGTDTANITAGKNVLDATSGGGTAFGYFLIEVSSDFENNYLNQNGNFNHISAIVSRYYLKENYVSSTSADSIIYTHQGAPQMLSSFKCRILNPDKTLAQNIGTDNTVMLQLIKAPPERKSIKNS